MKKYINLELILSLFFIGMLILTPGMLRTMAAGLFSIYGAEVGLKEVMAPVMFFGIGIYTCTVFAFLFGTRYIKGIL
jgi:hypothetical protein